PPVAGGAVASPVVIPQLVPSHNTTRVFSILVGNNGGQSLSDGRLSLWSGAWQAFTAHPLGGIGTGGFASLNLNGEFYPHNILLEAASELGILGLVLVLGVIGFSAVTLMRVWREGGARDRHGAALVSGLTGAAIANACVSGDIATNSTLWLAAG